MPGPAPPRFWTLQLARLVQSRDRVLDLFCVDDASDAHLRRRNHLDVDAVVRQRSEHGRRHAGLPADTTADDRDLGEAVLREYRACPDYFADALDDTLRLLAVGR